MGETEGQNWKRDQRAEIREKKKEGKKERKKERKKEGRKEEEWFRGRTAAASRRLSRNHFFPLSRSLFSGP